MTKIKSFHDPAIASLIFPVSGSQKSMLLFAFIISALFSIFTNQNLALADDGDFYFFQGGRISLERDPTCLACEVIPSISGLVLKSLPAGIQNTIEARPKAGRYVFQFSDESATEAAMQSKSVGVQSWYPVYRFTADDSLVWSYGEISIGLSAPEKRGLLEEFAAKNHLQIIDQSSADPHTVLARQLPGSSMSLCPLAVRLDELPYVDWAEPNFYGGRKLQSGDPYREEQTCLDRIEIDPAWQVTTGDPSIAVAVLDEGIDLNHPDLQSNIMTNLLEIPEDGIDNDSNGYIDDVQGWDFVAYDNQPVPDFTFQINAHGTAVGGIIAAVRNNDLGVAGIAPSCRLLPCKVFDGDSYAGDFRTAEAIRYAADYADVINCSWAGGAPSTVITNAIDYAASQGRNGKGCPIFFASGNGGGNPVSFPANYPWTVAVGENNQNDLRHEESNFGENLCLNAPESRWTTDISGPGGFDYPEEDYTSEFGGTSSSCPVASAVAALALSVDPGLSAAQVVLKVLNGLDNPLEGTAPNDLYGKSPGQGYGRINAARTALSSSALLDDRLEPNDSMETATPISRGYYPWLYLGETYDYYRIEGTQGVPIDCSIQFLSLLGSIDIILRDSNRLVVATSNITTTGNATRASIDYTPPQNGVYYLEVQPYPDHGIPYVLEAQNSPSDDAYEPNQDLDHAATLTPGMSKTYKGLVCRDDDYYKVFLDNEEYLFSLLSFDHSQADLGIQILDPDGIMVRSADGAAYGEQLDPYQAQNAGDHYIRVFNANGSANQEYSLHLGLNFNPPYEGSGLDDPFEENDTVATAAPIGEGFYPNLSLDDQNGEVRDLFRITVPPKKGLRLTLGWNGIEDLDLRLYPSVVQNDPPNTPPLARSTFVIQDVESVAIPAISSATDYWIDILRYVGSQTPYRFGVEFLDKAHPWLALFRFCEGEAGSPFNPLAIRDWRGPMFSHACQSYPGTGNWVAGADQETFPYADGLAVDCSNGGIYFPANGDRRELQGSDSDFTVWALVKPAASASDRTVCGIPGLWEIRTRLDNTFDFVTDEDLGSGFFLGNGPPVIPDEWQVVACVWNRSQGQVFLYSSDGSEWVEKMASIGPRTLSGSGTFHIGSTTNGQRGIGLIEQVNVYDLPLASAELKKISLREKISSQSNWQNYE